MRPKAILIGMGGAIASLGAGPLDVLDYGAAENRMQADATSAMALGCAAAEVMPVNHEGWRCAGP